MRYRLALDIGTASCGLVAVSLDDDNQPETVAHQSLHIFPEPLLPAQSGSVGEPKKAARRKARMARRIVDRRARRLKRIAMLSSLLGLDHRAIAASDGRNIHELRANASVQKIDLDDLIRVFLKLAKRRGYAGGFKTKKDGEEGQVQSGISQLEDKMEKAKCDTLGQYLFHRYSQGETLRLKEAGLYAHRDMLKKEFDVIWTTQAQQHPVLNEHCPDPILLDHPVRSIRDQFFDAVFYQRPLKSVAPMVGNCSLEPSLPRAPKAQNAAQQHRIEKQLADLRWGSGRRAELLTREQKEVIRQLLLDAAKLTKEGKLSFEKIYKELESRDLRPTSRKLNMERSSREELTGDRTSRAMKDLDMLETWKAFNDLARLRIINFLADLGSPEQVDQPEWHTRFTKTKPIKSEKTGRWETKTEPRKIDETVVAFINQLVETGNFDRLSKMGFESGRASYSIRALEKMAKYMREHNCDEHAAIQALYPSEAPAGELLMALPPHKPTGNVVVDVALRMVRRAVNDALSALGKPPSEVVIELSRDMALGVKARNDIEAKIKRNEKKRNNAKKELAANGAPVTETNILRYLLWEQQNTKYCPYCSIPINLQDAINGNETHFEHILPRSLTQVGRQRNQLVLAHRRCNDAKGDRTPYQAFGHDQDRWQAVEYCASVLRSNKQFSKERLLLLRDYEQETLDDATLNDFSERQFAETSWIGKLTAQWLRLTCSNVSVSRGQLTAHLRRIWKLETVIPQARFDAGLPVLDQDGNKITINEFLHFKAYWEGHHGREYQRTDRKIDKRIDHRHHLIDALTIAMTSRSLYMLMAKHYKELRDRRDGGESAVRMKLFVEPPMPAIRDKSLELVNHAKIFHKPDRFPSGALLASTAYRLVLDDEKVRLTIRTALIDLTDKNGSVDVARKRISDIASESTRKIVSECFEARFLSNGGDVKKALSVPIPDSRYLSRKKNEPRNLGAISHVKIFQRIGRGFMSGEGAIPVSVAGRSHQRTDHKHELRRHYKHYISDGYAFVRLVFDDAQLVKHKCESVSRFKASLPLCAQPVPGEIRVFRGDVLPDPDSGKLYLVHQILAGAKVRLGPVTEARIWEDLGSESGGISVGAKELSRMILFRKWPMSTSC